MVGKKVLAHTKIQKYKNTKIQKYKKVQKSTKTQNRQQVGEKGLVHRVCETDYKGSCHGAGVYAGGYLYFFNIYFCIFTFLYLKFCHGDRVHAGRWPMSIVSKIHSWSWWHWMLYIYFICGYINNALLTLSTLSQAILPQLEAAESVYRWQKSRGPILKWSYYLPPRYSWFVNRWPYSAKSNTSDWWENDLLSSFDVG